MLSIACVHSTCLPVYAAMRPMIATSVLSAIRSPSLRYGPSPLMLAIRSMCSCTYGLVCLPFHFHGCSPKISARPDASTARPLVPRMISSDLGVVPSCWRQ